MKTKIGQLLVRSSLSLQHLRLIGDIGSLSISTVVSRGLLFLRDLMLAGFLGPISYGVWIQMVVIFNYALHLPLGFQHAMSRDVPYFLGRKEYTQVATIEDIVFIVTLSTSILACFSVFLAYIVFDYHILGLSLLALLIVFAVIIAQQVNSFFSILLRAHQKFYVFSIGFVMIALLSLVLSVFFARNFGAIGAAAALGMAFIIVTIFWISYSPYKPTSIKINFVDFKKITRLAIPLFMIGLSGLLITSIDRLIIIFFYDKVHIGYYGLAFMVNQSIFLITMPIMQAIHPRMMQSYGKHGNPKKIKHYLSFLTQAMGVGVAFLIGIIYLIIDKIIIFFLPEFEPAIKIIQIILLGSSLAVLSSGANAFSVAINKQTQVLLIQVMVILFQAITIGSAAYFGSEIITIAKIMVLANFIYSFLSLALAGFSLQNSVIKGIFFGFKSYFIVLYVLLCMVIISKWSLASDQNMVFVKFMQLILFNVVIMPVFIFLFKSIRKLTNELSPK
ncbi:MAG: lipopolysaccharide biosynthesis protein [Desulfamplus sp.]|nr:lipopolysaccharide biosynthesis protein [Desulfamplus sp.]